MITSNNLKEINIELTTKCQAACPLCARNDYGYKTRTDFPIISLSFNDWCRIFDSVELPNIKRIVFNGSYGDPIINNHLQDILDYSFTKWPNIEIKVSTNGGIRSTKWWSTFGKKYKNNKLNIRFSIDGLEDTNQLYRIGVPFNKAISNAQAFIKAGGHAEWQWITFRHNQHQIEEAKRRSVEYGFKLFIDKQSSNNFGFVFTSDTDGYWIMPPNNIPEPAKLSNYIPDTKDSLKHYQKQELIWLSANREITCSSKNNQKIYISADSKVYPCSWVGHYPDSYKYNNFKQSIGDIENNAAKVGLEAAMLWLSKVESAWSCKSIKDGMLATCVGCTKDFFNQDC